MSEQEVKIFKPRDKNINCVHWVDCYKKSDWAVEFRGTSGSYFEFYCDYHKNELFKKEEIKKPLS